MSSPCGGREVPGQPGVKGMSTKAMKKMIEDYIEKKKGTKNGDELRKEFVRARPTKRADLCKFLEKFEEGRKAIADSVPKENRPAPPEPKTEMEKMYNMMRKKQENNAKKNRRMNAGGNFVMGEESERENSVNNNNGGEREGGNYGNKNNFNMRPAFVPVPRARAKEEKDPMKAKPSRQIQRQVKAKIRAMERAGVKLPNFKGNRTALMKFAMLTPVSAGAPKTNNKEALKRKREGRVNAKGPRPLKMMTFSGSNSQATARIPTQSKMVVSTATRLSRAESKAATEAAERVVAGIMAIQMPKADGMKANYNDIKGLLEMSAYGPNAPDVARKIANLNKQNYDSVREIIRRFELNKATVLKNLGAPIVEPEAPREAKASFSMVLGNGEPFSKKIAVIRKKKAGERSAADKRMLRVHERLTAMKAKTRRMKPTYKFSVRNRPMNMENSNNEGSNVEGNSLNNEGSKMEAILAKYESNSNSNNNGAARAAPRPKVNNKKQLRNRFDATNERKLKYNGTPIANMNKNALVNLATKMYKFIKPGEKIDFSKANKEKVIRLVAAGFKSPKFK